MDIVGLLIRGCVWAIVFLLVLDNLGVNITALVAGLGVGGIAVALAAQNIISDLFASLSIVLDRPFVLGDSYVESSNYALSMDIQQAVNLALFRRFADDGIEFAYPTQTLFVNRETATQGASQ